MQDCKIPGRCNLVHHPTVITAAKYCRAVEIAVSALNETRRLRALLSVKGVEHGEFTAGCKFENHANTVITTSDLGRPVKIAIRTLNQGGRGTIPVGAIKRVERRELAGWR